MVETGIIAACVVLAGILVPMAIGDIWFRKQGRELGYAICNALSATWWTGIWTYVSTMAIRNVDINAMILASFFFMVGVLGCALMYTLLIREIKKRRRVAAETLF